MNRLKTTIISKSGVYEVDELSANHSEADTRIIFHTFKVCENNESRLALFIESPDTDILSLLIGHYNSFASQPKIWFKTGVVTRLQDLLEDLRRYIPIHTVVASLGKSISHALPIVHCLTGCDTVSSFSGYGKTKLYNTIKKMKEADLDEFSIFYMDNVAIDDKVSVARKFIAQMYDNNNIYSKHHTSLNELRNCLIKTCVEKLPPSEPVFRQHIKRTAWQAYIWGSAIKSNIPFHDPIENGWSQCGKFLEPVYFEGQTSMEFINTYICGCKGKHPCSRNTCPCKINKLECCDACSCSELPCKNRSNELLNHSDDDQDQPEKEN